jgi:hypothetical protein
MPERGMGRLPKPEPLMKRAAVENPWKPNLWRRFWQYSALLGSLHTGGVTRSIPVAPTIFPQKTSHSAPGESLQPEFLGSDRSLCTPRGVQRPCKRIVRYCFPPAR